MIRKNETICAPATSAGGAIAVIRISGPESLDICSGIFSPARKDIILAEQNGYTVLFGEILSDSEILDEVLLTVFRAPHSYTGEDSVEISCHASPYIQKRIMELLVKGGASPAQPGEFTQRAFINGKIDLSQAEAVADLIASGSRMAHKMAMNQMRGYFSDEISVLRADLLHFASLIELELDFGEEDVEFADRFKLIEIVDKVVSVSKGLTKSFEVGNAIKNGVPVTIAGNPNTGKSTLLNRLLMEERAIVSDIPGTTRDAIEDTMIIDGIMYRFIDTAGLRDTSDVVENLGIKKTFEKIGLSSVVILVTDINEGTGQVASLISKIRSQAESEDFRKKIIIAVNKTDTSDQNAVKSFGEQIEIFPDEHLVFISAKTGEGIDKLKSILGSIAGLDIVNSENIIISNARHYHALSQVTDSLERVRTGLENNISDDLISIDIRQAIHYLGEITGEITTDEILGNIFRNFCIGK